MNYRNGARSDPAAAAEGPRVGIPPLQKRRDFACVQARVQKLSYQVPSTRTILRDANFGQPSGSLKERTDVLRAAKSLYQGLGRLASCKNPSASRGGRKRGPRGSPPGPPRLPGDSCLPCFPHTSLGPPHGPALPRVPRSATAAPEPEPRKASLRAPDWKSGCRLALLTSASWKRFT